MGNRYVTLKDLDIKEVTIATLPAGAVPVEDVAKKWRMSTDNVRRLVCSTNTPWKDGTLDESRRVKAVKLRIGNSLRLMVLEQSKPERLHGGGAVAGGPASHAPRVRIVVQ